MASTDSYWMIGFALMCIITIVGCTAHIVMLLVILSVQNLRQNPSNSFIVTLSLTGLLATSIVFPLAIAIYFDSKSGSINWMTVGSNCSTDQNIGSLWGMCTVLPTLHNFSIYSSAWLVSAIAIERNVFIIRPFYAASTLKYALLNATVIGCSMVFALVPNLLSSNLSCYSPYAYNFHDPILSWLQFVVVYLLPSIIIVLMYLNIYRVTQNVQRTIQPTPSLFPPRNDTTPRIWTVNPIVVPQTDSDTTPKKKHNKAIRTLLLTIGSYIVLWSPYWVFNMIPIVHHEDLQCDAVWYILNNGSITVTWLLYSSISFNPLLYGLLNRAIRTEIKGKLQMTKQFLSCKNSQTEATNQEVHGANAAENFW
jgi:hypothetical protein